MHMSVMSALTARLDRFNWLLGTRVALAFGLPVAVAHAAGRAESDAAVIAFAGLLVALIAGSLPAGRVRRVHGPAVVAAVALASVLFMAMPAHHPIGVGVMATGLCGCCARSAALARSGSHGDRRRDWR